MESPGARLKQIRLEKGLSLDEVHKKTKMHLSVLKSIEEDNLVNVSPVYIKGFLKIYCKFLGVDPADFIADYKAPQQSVRYFTETQEQPVSFWRVVSRKLWFFLPRIQIKTVLLTVAAIILVWGLLGFVKFISSRRHQPVPDTKPAATAMSKPVKAAASAARKTPASAVAVKSAPPAPKEEAQPAAPAIRLIIRAKADCYVQLKTDGHTVFQSTLKKGRFEAWSAKEKIEFSVGNAGALDLEVNGKPMPSLGRRGQALKNITITKDGLKVP